MKKGHFITILGLLVILVPLLGIPDNFKVIIFTILGLAIVVLSLERKKLDEKEVESDSQSETPNLVQ